MSDCPFKLPLVFEEAGPFSGFIRDGTGEALAGRVIDARQALYIIRAVNTFEKAKEALRPFAELASFHNLLQDDHIVYVSVRNLRRAAAVLKEMEDEG